jgi:hypothetical protein
MVNSLNDCVQIDQAGPCRIDFGEEGVSCFVPTLAERLAALMSSVDQCSRKVATAEHFADSPRPWLALQSARPASPRRSREAVRKKSTQTPSRSTRRTTWRSAWTIGSLDIGVMFHGLKWGPVGVGSPARCAPVARQSRHSRAHLRDFGASLRGSPVGWDVPARGEFRLEHGDRAARTRTWNPRLWRLVASLGAMRPRVPCGTRCGTVVDGRHIAGPRSGGHSGLGPC